MAFAYVAAAHYDNAATLSAACSKPTGTTTNDIMFALVKHNSTDTFASTPTDWVQVATTLNVGGLLYSVWWKVAGGSEPSDYTWSWTAGTAARTSISIVTYRDGFDTGDPIDVVSGTVYNVSDTIWRAAGMTVSAANSPIIFFGLHTSATSLTAEPPTNPATFTEDLDYYGGTDGRTLRHVASVIWTSSGATGDMDATLPSSLQGKPAFAVALNPAAGGSPITNGPALVSVRGNIRFN